jgi:hypothetical protein
MKRRGPIMTRASAAIIAVLLCAAAGAAPPPAAEPYLGARDAIVVAAAGCNSSAYSAVPGSNELFLGRLLLTAEGELPALNGPADCSGGNPDNQKTGKIFSRWALSLHHFDWGTHRFSIVKTVLDTSLDPATGQARAVVSGGPMRGAIIQSAYDPSLVSYHGTDYVAFECIVSNGGAFGVDGTSSCIGVYDPLKQQVDLGRTQVIVSGFHGPDRNTFHAAAVPQLLVFQDRLYLYWSALTVTGDKFQSAAMRGAELEAGAFISVKGSQGRLVRSMDEPATVEVWAPQPGDPLSDTTVDARAVWASGNSVIAVAGKGGSGCTAPDGPQQGCFRLAMVRSARPLGPHVFNQAQPLKLELPSNPEEYTAVMHDPQGMVWLLGHYIKPPANGWSELRPVPGGDYWSRQPPHSAQMVMFPLGDPGLAPQ